MSTIGHEVSIKQDQIDARRKEHILSLAMGEAITWGTTGAIFGATTVAVLSFTSPKFKKLTQISAKVAIPTMMGLGLFSLKYEHAISRMRREPHLVGLSDSDIVKGKVSHMPAHHRIANAMYDHPFAMLAGCGMPLAGYIFTTQWKHKHLKVSQRIMQTRVFAQGGILLMLLSVMGFRGWMEKRGHFPDDQGED